MTKLLTLFAAMLALLLGSPAVLAQEATPAAGTGLDTMGALPELNVVITDAGFEGLPAETPAGRYLVNVTNSTAEPASVGFIQIPEGQTLDELLAPMMAMMEAEASPMAEMADEMTEASPVAGAEGAEDPFAWLYGTYVPGGAWAPAGGTGQSIIDLRAGEYVAWNDDPFSLPGASQMTVTEAAASPVAEDAVAADVTIRELGVAGQGYSFVIEGELRPGVQVIEVVNESDQPHFAELVLLPVPVTLEQLMALLMGEEGATPPADLPAITEEDIELAWYAPSQSAGTTQWVVADLQPGNYWIACWVPDPAAGGIPHALEGMIDLVEIGDAVATPIS